MAGKKRALDRALSTQATCVVPEFGNQYPVRNQESAWKQSRAQLGQVDVCAGSSNSVDKNGNKTVNSGKQDTRFLEVITYRDNINLHKSKAVSITCLINDGLIPLFTFPLKILHCHKPCLLA